MSRLGRRAQAAPGDTEAETGVLVGMGIHSRGRAADELGVEDPEGQFRRWLEERAMGEGRVTATALRWR